MEFIALVVIVGCLCVIALLQSRATPDHKNYDWSSHDDVPEKKQAKTFDALKDDIHYLPKFRVEWVIDGDTVVLSQGWRELRVRLDSIDCPEDGQEWGDIAKYGLIKMIGKQKVHLEEHGIDAHGRTLGTLYVWNYKKNQWMNINERMVTLGHAWVMKGFYDHLPPDRQDKLNRLQGWACAKKIGLWKSENPIPPWEWRKGT